MSLFLSGNAEDVKAAVSAGEPAGHLRPSRVVDDVDDTVLRVAFDFDGVLADDAAEQYYRSAPGIDDYLAHENAHRDEALDPGPLKPLLQQLNRIQQLEETRSRNDDCYVPRLRIALVTARNAPAHERAITSLRRWDVQVNEAFFLGGIAKARILDAMKPHIFFDDQLVHLDGLEGLAAAHVPYGIANQPPAGA